MYSIANNVYLGIFWIIHTIPEIESVPKLYPKLYIFGNFDVKWSVILIEWRLKNDIFDPKITIFVTIVLNYIVNKWLSKLEGGFG